MTPHYYVNYSIGTRDYQVGPYLTYEIAEDHRRDIAGYYSVYACSIGRTKSLTRIAVGMADAPEA